ncbi:heavy metal transport/detoxification protein [Amycolatopsis acidiphila]|nr:heavy metal transport/detoxification protein [Amycolatopsis acidiphila]
MIGTMTQTSYTVTGMTCEHCVKAVTEEVGRIEGVESVAVDLPSGALTVVSSGELSDDAVRAAVDEAGYQVA